MKNVKYPTNDSSRVCLKKECGLLSSQSGGQLVKSHLHKCVGDVILQPSSESQAHVQAVDLVFVELQMKDLVLD